MENSIVTALLKVYEEAKKNDVNVIFTINDSRLNLMGQDHIEICFKKDDIHMVRLLDVMWDSTFSDDLFVHELNKFVGMYNSMTGRALANEK